MLKQKAEDLHDQDASLVLLVHQREEILPKDNCVSNILYSRRLPSPPIFRRDVPGGASKIRASLGASSSTTAAAARRTRLMSKDDNNATEMASHLTNHASQPMRKLFCPLCTQTFGYSFGLECHLLSVHFKDLLNYHKDNRRKLLINAQTCPCCQAQFLKPGIVIRHLVYQHPDYVTNTLLAPTCSPDEVASRHVQCRFCGQQFLKRHQKLLMLHIEQKHVSDLEAILPGLKSPMKLKLEQPQMAPHQSVELSLMLSSPTVQEAVRQKEKRSSSKNNSPISFLEDHQYISPDALKEKHHYYEIIDDGEIVEDVNKENGKRDRSSEEDKCRSPSPSSSSVGSQGKIKQVKKRLKRIENKNTEKRRSLEVQELLRSHQLCPPATGGVNNALIISSATETFLPPSVNKNRRRTCTPFLPPKPKQEKLSFSSSTYHSHDKVTNPPPKQPTTPNKPFIGGSYQLRRKKLPEVGKFLHHNHHTDEDDDETTNFYRRIPQPEPPPEKPRSGHHRQSIFSRQPSLTSTTSSSSSSSGIGTLRAGSVEESDDSDLSYGRWSLTRRSSSRKKKKQKQHLASAFLNGGEQSGAEQKKLYKCNLCEVAFLENAFLLSHLKNKHRSTMSKLALRPQYSCGACPAKFFKNSFLVKHCECHQFELVDPNHHGEVAASTEFSSNAKDR